MSLIDGDAAVSVVARAGHVERVLAVALLVGRWRFEIVLEALAKAGDDDDSDDNGDQNHHNCQDGKGNERLLHVQVPRLRVGADSVGLVRKVRQACKVEYDGNDHAPDVFSLGGKRSEDDDPDSDGDGGDRECEFDVVRWCTGDELNDKGHPEEEVDFEQSDVNLLFGSWLVQNIQNQCREWKPTWWYM